MEFFKQRWVRIIAAFAIVTVVAACGVKSSPGTPEGATYSRTYPPVPVSSQNAQPAPQPTTRTSVPGAYQPPPPATQLSR